MARLELLTDDDMDFVADLIWSPRRELRVEAATFVDQHYFIESVIDLVKGQRCFRDRAAGQRRTTMLHCLNDQVASRRRVSTLVQFVKDHKTRTQQFRLTERLVDGLWGRASCLEDWRTFAALALPGEGCIADEERFMGEERLILAHFMEASARLATDDLVASRYLEEAGSAVDTLNTAVTTFVWRIPELLVANKSEAVAFPLCVQFSRHLLRHLALQVGRLGYRQEVFQAAFRQEFDANVMEAFQAASRQEFDVTAQDDSAELLECLRQMSCAGGSVLDALGWAMLPVVFYQTNEGTPDVAPGAEGKVELMAGALLEHVARHSSTPGREVVPGREVAHPITRSPDHLITR